MKKRGFTLVEILVVVVIIGILFYSFFLKQNNWQEPFKIEMVKFFNLLSLSVDNYPFDMYQEYRPKPNEKVTNILLKFNNKGIEDYRYYTYAENKKSLSTNSKNSKNLINLWNGNKVYYHWEKNGVKTLYSTYHRSYNHTTWLEELKLMPYIDILARTGANRWINDLEMAECYINQKEHEDWIKLSTNDIKKWIFLLIDRKNIYISKTLENNYINSTTASTLTDNDIIQVHSLHCNFFVNNANEGVLLSWTTDTATWVEKDSVKLKII